MTNKKNVLFIIKKSVTTTLIDFSAPSTPFPVSPNCGRQMIYEYYLSKLLSVLYTCRRIHKWNI